MTESGKSPLGRLVLFIICLAVAGSIVATTHYYAIDLPDQNSVLPPENKPCNTDLCKFCRACGQACWAKSPAEWNYCFDQCDTHGCHFNDD